MGTPEYRLNTGVPARKRVPYTTFILNPNSRQSKSPNALEQSA